MGKIQVDISRCIVPISYPMDTIQKARRVILEAESSLRDLISRALDEQRYGDVKEIAELADRVARLISRNDIQLSASPSSGTAEKSAPRYSLTNKEPDPDTKNLDLSPVRKPSAKKKDNSRTKSKYPKFVNDGDRLVKIGWSKKNKAEYEHRVPREAVQGFLRHLDQSVEPEKLFDIESLFPVQNVSGEEIPGYQIYVVIAWLREAGVVEKKGRDGYLVHDKTALGEANELWNALPTKSG